MSFVSARLHAIRAGRDHADPTGTGPAAAPPPPLMGFRRREHHASSNGQISRDVSLYIMAHGPGGVPQGGGNSNVQRASSDRVTWIYRTMQFDNALQDTER